MKKLIFAIFLVSLFLPTVCLAADASVVNHVMANKIECAPGKGCEVLGPTSVQFEIPKGQPAAKHKFSALDQVIFDAGTYKVEQKILEEGTGQVVAAIKPISITVKNNREIRHLNVSWEFATKVGNFTYQILVDDRVIGAFRISVLAGK